MRGTFPTCRFSLGFEHDEIVLHVFFNRLLAPGVHRVGFLFMRATFIKNWFAKDTK
jgi:hypothetical protein